MAFRSCCVPCASAIPAATVDAATTAAINRVFMRISFDLRSSAASLRAEYCAQPKATGRLPPSARLTSLCAREFHDNSRDDVRVLDESVVPDPGKRDVVGAG